VYLKGWLNGLSMNPLLPDRLRGRIQRTLGRTISISFYNQRHGERSRHHPRRRRRQNDRRLLNELLMEPAMTCNWCTPGRTRSIV
jgi:hypothetical protein